MDESGSSYIDNMIQKRKRVVIGFSSERSSMEVEDQSLDEDLAVQMTALIEPTSPAACIRPSQMNR